MGRLWTHTTSTREDIGIMLFLEHGGSAMLCEYSDAVFQSESVALAGIGLE